MHLLVGHSFEQFLSGLEKPMKLNEMRNMKEPNYSKFRSVIRDPKNYGDPVLKALAENSSLVGISANSYHLVFESFWDLYCKKPVTPDLTSKKLEGWVNSTLLKVPTWAAPEAPAEPTGEGDEVTHEPEEPVGQIGGLPVKAVARVRIPFKRPEPEEIDEDLDPAEKEAKEEERRRALEAPLQEIDCEDKVEQIPTQGDAYQIFVVHQLAQRRFRELVAKEFKDSMPQLQSISEDELIDVVEREAENIEQAFFEKLFPDLAVFDFEIN
mmetsp:Transcript_7483/g.11669  ORF Transcript_7483/g.11669 Transcript_7483/m.11669 type:complete len:268 (-) Transcript_7483:61-864(-)